MNDEPPARPATYSARARRMHWFTVAFLLLLFPIGIAMDWRGNHLGIWDSTTNNLYGVHRLLGFVLLVFIAVPRLTWRLMVGAPADEPGLAPWQRFASHVTHWALYALLIAVPLGGWMGTQLYGALDVLGLFNLPAFLAPNKAAAERVLWLHALGAFALLALIGGHIGAALYHHFIRGDGVLRRMLPPRK